MRTRAGGTHARAAKTAMILLLATAAGGSGLAQTPATGSPQAPAAPKAAAAEGTMPRVALTAGRSTVLTTDFNISRIAVTNPAVADATVVQPREILIDGKAPGTISLIVWGQANRAQYDLVVEPAVTTLQQQLQTLFPGEDIQVGASEDATILSGQVSNTNVMLRAGEIAQASAAKRSVINLLQVPGGSESQQVLLQVRFAEVNRRVLKELGISLFLHRDRVSARTTTQQFAAPDFRRHEAGGAGVQRFPQSVLSSTRRGHRGGDEGAGDPRRLSEPGRAEPDCVQRPGSQLPGRRRVPGAGRAGRLPAP